MLTLAELVGRCDRVGVAAISIARSIRGGTIDAFVSGQWPNGRTVGVDDRFYAASLAKQVTGAAAAVLVCDGKLNPDGAIGKYLRDLPGWVQDVTARQLAQHTSGLPAAGILESRVAGDWSEAAAIAALHELPRPEGAQGSSFAYSNVGYIILARLVAAVSGMPFAAFVADRLLAPHALDGMAFEPTPLAFPQLQLMGDQLPLTHGDGGLWSTASAFARWLQLQNSDALGVGAIVEAPTQLKNGGTSAYGWGIGLRSYHGHRLLIHAGQWTGCVAKSVRCPELGIGIVALAAATRFETVDRLVPDILDDAAASY